MNSPRNVLLIAIDTLRADHLGCYGYGRRTSPNIDAFARGAVRFDRFFASAVPTQPSFTTLYTGQYSLTHGIVTHKGGASLAAEAPWLPELLREFGLTTASFCCLPRYKHWFQRGFEFVVDSTRRSATKGYEYNAEIINRRALPWLKRHADEPFFMVVHYWDPHAPYLPREKDRIFYEGDPTDPSLPNTLDPMKNQYFSEMWKRWFSQLPSPLRDAEYVKSLYDGEVLRVDEAVGQLLATLSETGHDEDTLVLLLSDHGELFYRHDIFFDHHGLYDGTIRCPLIVRWPGVTEPNGRVSPFAGHQDIAPTLLRILGASVPETMEGADLGALLRGGTTPVRDAVVSQECTWQAKWALRTETEKLILARQPDLHGSPMRELYDLVADPDELENIAEVHPERADALEARLEDWIRTMMVKNDLAEDPLRLTEPTYVKLWEAWSRTRERAPTAP